MSTYLAQRIALVFGIVYVAIGLLGFVPGVTVSTAQAGQSLLLGIFAVNRIHNIAHLAVGALLIWAGISAEHFSWLGKALAAVFALLVIVSFVAPIAEGVAINLPDTALHLVSALLVGFLAFGSTPARRQQRSAHS
ncbi:MAG: DUF4383 domain-containing protein [Chloroflexi bacterium]|nr:DUF4383 domain-containing protein [Chloroflexota bacterium]